MKSITTAMAAHLQGETTSLAMLWLLTLQDSTVMGFTNHDLDIVYGGVTFKASTGANMGAIESSADLSTSNLEIDALLTGNDIYQADVEAGRFNHATVTVSLVNFMDLTMGSVLLQTGITGAFTLQDGQFKAEVRSLNQILQQQMGELYTPICRASLGDSRCKVDLTPYTFTGTVTSLVNASTFIDTSLTQVGPNSSYIDTTGHKIPTVPPYTIKVAPPTGGAFVSNTSVTHNGGQIMGQVSPNPWKDHYVVAPDGTYTFDVHNKGELVDINYVYQIGYFAYGVVKWLTGANAGYEMEVKSFAPQVVTLAMLMPFPIQPGDTYKIVAGCDGQISSCKNRYNNVVNFRGEPYIPGPDFILRPQW